MWVIIIVWMISIFQNVSSSEIASKNQQPEYRSGRFSVGFYVFLPVAGLMFVIFGRRSVFEKLLLLNSKFMTVICPWFIQREAVLKWACTRLPSTWSSPSTKTLSGGIKELWTDGSLLCTMINTFVPGACPNPYRHWKQPPVHAQALAYKYFGVAPIFTSEDLKKNLSTYLERKYVAYLSELQQSIYEISESSDSVRQISERYVARGMGLFSGEQFKAAEFYIYLDEKNDNGNDSNVIIQIKGPFGSHGEAVSPKLINKHRKFRKKSNTERRSSLSLIENLNFSWSFTINEKKAPAEDIDIEATLENDRIKVCYVPKHFGMYEINMIVGGELVKGCPFSVHIFVNDDHKNEPVKKLKPQKSLRKIVGTSERYLFQEDSIPEERLTPTKSTFNFKEVIEEITKSGSVFEKLLNCEIEAADTTSKLQVTTKISDEGDLTEGANINNNKYFHPEDTIITTNLYDNLTSSITTYRTTAVTNIEDNESGVLDHVNISGDVSRYGPSNSITAPPSIHRFNHMTTVENNTNTLDGSTIKNFKPINEHKENENNIEFYNDNLDKKIIHKIDKKIEICVSETNSNGLSVTDRVPQVNDNKMMTTYDKLEGKNTVINTKEISDKKDSNYVTIEKIHADNGREKINTRSVNKQISSGGNNFKTNIASEPIFTNKEQTTATEIKQLDHDYTFFVSEYAVNLNINKIKIPEMFLDKQTRNINSRLDDKYFKNILNESNKVTRMVNSQIPINEDKVDGKDMRDSKENKYLGNMESILEKDVNNSDALKGRIAEYVKHLEKYTSTKISSNKDKERTKHASPIWYEHIEPEVDRTTKMVAEKIKILAPQSLGSEYNSKCSSFSENESSLGSSSKDSRLGFKDSKETENFTRDSWSLSSAVSLPNLSLESEWSSSSSVKDRRVFWENVCGVSSESPKSLSPRKVKSHIGEMERSRFIWSKSDKSNFEDKENIEKNSNQRSNFSVSADNISSIARTEKFSLQATKNFISVDDSLDTCTLLSIEQRKKLLLKQGYEIEKAYKQIPKKDSSFYNKQIITDEPKIRSEHENISSSISEPITTSHKASKLSSKEAGQNISKIKRSQSFHNTNIGNVDNIEVQNIPERQQFKKAIDYFINLETKYQNTRLTAKKLSDATYSKPSSRYRSSSLSKSNVSKKFSVNNLYDDVFGERKGSFKGTPNRSALVQALATFSRNSTSINKSDNSEDSIKYEMFQYGKKRKRRSLNGVFDIYY